MRREHKEFRIGDVLEKVEAKYLGRGKSNSNVVGQRDAQHTLPVTSAKKGDNGICRWARRGDFTEHSNVVSIVYNGAIAAGLAYAQPGPVGVLADSYLVRVKDRQVPFEANLYLACAIQKVAHAKYSREKKATWDRVKDDHILLPVTPAGEPDFEYMAERIRELEAERIRELEAERIRELEAYLIASGLSDAVLTDEDKAVLAKFRERERESSKSS